MNRVPVRSSDIEDPTENLKQILARELYKGEG
jgi:hypothetical protein